MNKQKKYYNANKESISKKVTLRRYGLTEDKYNSMLVEQQFSCALCKTHQSETPLFIDHCHETDKVRGLLCNKCNSCLGGFEHHYKNLASVLFYIERTH